MVFIYSSLGTLTRETFFEKIGDVVSTLVLFSGDPLFPFLFVAGFKISFRATSVGVGPVRRTISYQLPGMHQ